jgi:hypothetical protein
LEVNPEEGLAKEDLVKKQHHKHTLFFCYFPHSRHNMMQHGAWAVPLASSTDFDPVVHPLRAC